MKTRRRVKRTVREMPRRLTIRLSKGSNRNMVEGPGMAMPSSLRTKHSLQMVLSDSTSPGKEASSQQKTNSIPKFTSFNGLERKLGSRTIVKRATGSSLKTPDLPGTGGLWR